MITIPVQIHAPEPHLVEGALGVGVHDLLQHAPVGAWDVLGDAAAALQIELVHLLADVVAQHRCIPADCLLECTDWWACVHVPPLQHVSGPLLTQGQQSARIALHFPSGKPECFCMCHEYLPATPSNFPCSTPMVFLVEDPPMHDLLVSCQIALTCDSLDGEGGAMGYECS